MAVIRDIKLKEIPFLTEDKVRSIQNGFGTPVYVYDQKTLERQAHTVGNFPNAFGLTARYAMKACSAGAVLKVLTGAGLHIDASSGYEAERAMLSGIPPEKIQITAQQVPGNLKELVNKGVLFNACSIAQIHEYGALFHGSNLSIRVNPGLGSGHNNRTNVGGPSASFGIWHEHLPEALLAAKEYNLTITGMHTHIGSGSDPKVWQHIALMSLDICSRLPDAAVLSLGGGFKVGRVKGEKTTDLQKIGLPVKKAFQLFEKKYKRKLHMEIEPGTYLAANSGAIVAKIIDIADTGRKGYKFIKTDTGMTEILRPSMYGAQHPIEVVPVIKGSGSRRKGRYVVAGHCCESSDVLTPAPGDPEGLLPRLLPEPEIGDLIVIGGAGAYCSSMSTGGYNSFPEAAEVMILKNGSAELIRKRQTMEQMIQNEKIPAFLSNSK